MTDEELRVRAIQELEFYKKDDTFMLADITVDLAIKALEQMPVTTTAGEGGVIYYPQVEGVTPTIIDAGKQERDVIDRAEAIKIASGYCHPANVAKELAKLPPVNPTKTGHWIPVSERLPEDLEPVNITWVNHEPEPYYHDIKDRNFVATGIYYRGQWYWYSTTCADYLGEYGSNEIDKVDDAVEIIAWMPLPKPYEPQERSGEE